jgi:hypothetical protein
MAIWAAILPSRTCCWTASGNSSTNAKRRPTHVGLRSKRRASSSIEQPSRLSISASSQPCSSAVSGSLMRSERSSGFAHRPHDGLYRVAPQLFERGHAFVTVDDQIAARVFDDDDRRLLAGFSQ